MIDQHVSIDNWKPTFEIDLVLRDSKGNDTGKRKNFTTDSPYKLSDFFVKNQTKPKKKVMKKHQLTGEQAKEVTQELYKNDEARLTKLDEIVEKTAGENTATNV